MASKTRPRSKRPKLRLDDLYGGGDSGNLLNSRYIENQKVYAWFQKRHSKGYTLLDEDGVYYTRDGEHAWRVPYGIRQAMAVPLSYNQVVVKYPFYVTWISPKTGKRHKKYVPSIISGVHLIAERVQYADPDAWIVSRTVGYVVPEKLRGKFPRQMNGKHMYWCPCCMTARRFRRRVPLEDFYAQKKFWSEEKKRYIWKDVKLALLECAVCGITNRDRKFRASNQPYEKRRIKRGVRRLRKRKR